MFCRTTQIRNNGANNIRPRLTMFSLDTSLLPLLWAALCLFSRANDISIRCTATSSSIIHLQFAWFRPKYIQMSLLAVKPFVLVYELQMKCYNTLAVVRCFPSMVSPRGSARSAVFVIRLVISYVELEQTRFRLCDVSPHV